MTILELITPCLLYDINFIIFPLGETIADIPLLVQNAKEVPMWIFHGEKDPVVSPEPNRELYKALMTAGAKDVTYSEYPGVAHDSWTNAFAEPKLLPWLFSHKKRVKKN